MEIINWAKRVGLGTEHPAGQFTAALGSGWEKLFGGCLKQVNPPGLQTSFKKKSAVAPQKFSEHFYSLFLFLYFSLE